MSSGPSAGSDPDSCEEDDFLREKLDQPIAQIDITSASPSEISRELTPMTPDIRHSPYAMRSPLNPYKNTTIFTFATEVKESSSSQESKRPLARRSPLNPYKASPEFQFYEERSGDVNSNKIIEDDSELVDVDLDATSTDESSSQASTVREMSATQIQNIKS